MTAQPVAQSRGDLLRGLASGSIQADSITRAELTNILSWCRTRQDAMINKIRAHIAAGNTRIAWRDAGKLRRSLPARFIALYESAPERFRADSFSSREELEARWIQRLRWALDHLGQVGSLTEPVSVGVRLVPKKQEPQPGQPRCYPSHLRAIFEFGCLEKARQRLLARSLLPFVDFHPSQYMIQDHPEGRGRSGVCEALRLQLTAMGPDTVFLQIDVRNFYGSINHRWLEAALRLPEDIIRSQVHTGLIRIRRLRALPNHGHLTDGVCQELVRRGIPGGSALSSLIGELVMADVLRGLPDLPEGTLFFTYSDNIGVFCPEAAAPVIMDLFRARFDAHGAGPFELTFCRPRSIYREFRFLGHWWIVTNNRVEVYVPPGIAYTKLFSIYQRAELISEHGSPDYAAVVHELLRLAKSIRQQASEWRLWPGAAEWVRDAMGFVLSAAALHCQPSVIAQISDLEHRALEAVQQAERRQQSLATLVFGSSPRLREEPVAERGLSLSTLVRGTSPRGAPM